MTIKAMAEIAKGKAILALRPKEFLKFIFPSCFSQDAFSQDSIGKKVVSVSGLLMRCGWQEYP